MTLTANSRWIILLRDGHFEEFNRMAAQNPPDLKDANLRMLDLRQADLARADLRGAYLRNADLRGLDLSKAALDGASMRGARVSGVLFPKAIPADEIHLSLVIGTRVRAR